ncbi:Putative L-isoaspartate O-methyltransferase [Sandaracinus amylolyticus]|uniref:Putative L-isoaspartate O-methyltransferase n=2 Tax=Sandaracinus amylolyticus TaxID=927083 RepID=A0A0F6W2W8_9BACT|nr:Putative L-isoaspartate O-methyltransferase [Sandaracinus amylolyticus]
MVHISLAMSRPTSIHPGERRAPEIVAERREISVPVKGARVEGDLVVPSGARGLVVFAHGSGSSRHSPRNRYVAEVLQRGKLATLLLDLLTREEEAIDARTAHLRFDIELLAERLVSAIEWARRDPSTRELRLGFFGASTGGGAALVAAALRPDAVAAVVSRGGRPDLAGNALPVVRAPTLLIVGGDDVPVLELHREAIARMRNEVHLEVIVGATHLFEEPGALEEVGRLAREFLTAKLGGIASPS